MTLPLATPEIINESVQITQYSLQKYREMRRQGKIDDMSNHEDVNIRGEELYKSAMKIVSAIETYVEDPYSAEGFYKIFAAGFLPVPYLWSQVEEFKHAKNWRTKPIKGSIKVVDENNEVMKSEEIIEIAKNNLMDAEYNLKNNFMNML